MAFKARLRSNFSISAVIRGFVYTILALYVGGTVIEVLGNVMENKTSALFTGLELIGWTVTANQITATTEGGVLSVIGIIAIAGVVMKFIKFSF